MPVERRSRRGMKPPRKFRETVEFNNEVAVVIRTFIELFDGALITVHNLFLSFFQA